MRVERLDLVNLRLVEAGDDTAIPLEEQLSALEDMRQEGKLDLIGLSNVDQAQVQLALEFVDVAEIQNGYSIIDRQDDELVEFAREREIAFVPFFPLGSAFRAGRRDWPADAGDRPGRRQARGDADADRSGVVAGSLRPDAADSGHELGRAPRGEHGCDRARAR